MCPIGSDTRAVINAEIPGKVPKFAKYISAGRWLDNEVYAFAKSPAADLIDRGIIAPTFVFLAAPSCSSYITGEVLPIIGGY